MGNVKALLCVFSLSSREDVSILSEYVAQTRMEGLSAERAESSFYLQIDIDQN